MVYLYSTPLSGTQTEKQKRRKLTWKKEANGIHKKNLPAGRRCVFKSATAPILEEMFQKHSPDRANYWIIFSRELLHTVSYYLKITYISIFFWFIKSINLMQWNILIKTGHILKWYSRNLLLSHKDKGDYIFKENCIRTHKFSCQHSRLPHTLRHSHSHVLSCNTFKVKALKILHVI